MAKEKTAMPVVAVLQDFFHTGIYKRSQGRVTRQVTCCAIWVTFGLAAWSLKNVLVTSKIPNADIWIPGALLLFGLWCGYRLVNLPRFADFLIAVEAEMNKVSWPSRAELFRSALVVVVVIFVLAIVLFGFDVFWKFAFTKLGVLQS